MLNVPSKGFLGIYCAISTLRLLRLAISLHALETLLEDKMNAQREDYKNTRSWRTRILTVEGQ